MASGRKKALRQKKQEKIKQRAEKKEARRGVDIEAVYQEYKKLHEELPKKWNRQHWDYDKASLKFSQQVVHAIGAPVSKGKVMISTSQMQKVVRDIVVLEHSKQVRDYDFSKVSPEDTIAKLEQFKKDGNLTYNEYRKFKRRITESDPERRKLEYGKWMKELYDTLKGKYSSSDLAEDFKQIFFGS